MLFKLSQYANALNLNDVTLSGILTFSNFLQFKNTPYSISVNSDGSFTSLNSLQYLNANFLILLTVSDISTLDSFVQ